MNEHGPLWLVKSSIIQMACSTQSLVSTIPSLAQIMKEHRESNPIEMERLQKMLEEKEVELVKETDRLTQREVDLQA